MDFDHLLDQAIEMLQRRGRLTYRTLKRQFELDDETLEDLTLELIEGQRLATDENGTVLIWAGKADGTPEVASQSEQVTPSPVIEVDTSTPIEPSPIETPPLSTETHTPEAERRQLTILFTDLVDSTKLSGQLDPEDYREVVRAYQTACAEVTERLECHIAQTLGDGLLIYSGYPVAHENDAERAIRVGLGILDAMKTLNERLEQGKGIQIAVRVGIHTGTVVVGEVGAGTRQEQLALGEVPNIAARLQGLADPDTVVISAATYRLIEGYFECEVLGEQDLRGVSQPVVVYRVWHESGIQNRLDLASRRGLTPLVGRDQEVSWLLSRWDWVKEGHGQVILLSGEAGIGKSRLVQALKASVATVPSTRLECRSSPYHQNTALYPIVDLIQRILQWQQEDTPEVKLEKLEQALSPYGVVLDESVSLFASLLSLSLPATRYPPLNFSPQLQRQRTFEVIVSILLELAARQPLLFILEDLHWTDPTTLEFINLLIDQAPAAPLCVLLTCRPTFQPSWSHRSYLTEMTVNRLTHAQVEEIVARLAEGHQMPENIRRHIVERTDGVPLFVEELTKAILESAQVQANAASLIIPTTLQDSLMARLDRLVTAKGVAQIGATIGRQFSYALLRAVSPLNETDLRRELRRLVEAELLYQHGLPPQAAYTFKHALIQDAAYESLLKSTRQHYHQRIIQVLETQFPDVPETQPELLAHHYTEAGDIEPAVCYWHKAGEQAIRRSAHTEATYHLTRGLEVLVALPDRPTRTQLELTLQITLGSVLLATKGYAALEVEQTYAHAYQLCQHVGDGAQRTQVLLGLRNFYQLRGDLNTAYELGQEALRLATTQGDGALLVQAHHAVAHTLLFKGVFVSARGHAEQSLALYHPQQHQTWVFRSGTGDLRVQSLATLSWILGPLGYVDQAVMRINEALDIARQLNHPFSLATALAFATWVYRNRQEPHRVHEPAEELMALATKHGFAFQWARGVFIQGWARAKQGEGLEGIAQMHEGMAAMQKTSTALGQTGWLTALAEACTQLDWLDEAHRFVTEALVLTDKYDLRLTDSDLHYLMGEILLKQHGITNGEEAEEHLRQALTIARNQEAKLFELHAATSLARLWQQQGKRQEAHDLLAPVYEWFTEGFDTADLKDAKALLDELAT